MRTGDSFRSVIAEGGCRVGGRGQEVAERSDVPTGSPGSPHRGGTAFWGPQAREAAGRWVDEDEKQGRRRIKNKKNERRVPRRDGDISLRGGHRIRTLPS